MKKTKSIYSVMKMCNDTTVRKKTLLELSNEIECTNPYTIVQITSQKKGWVWCGHAKRITENLCKDYLKSCVQNIEEDEYGITLIMR